MPKQQQECTEFNFECSSLKYAKLRNQIWQIFHQNRIMLSFCLDNFDFFDVSKISKKKLIEKTYLGKLKSEKNSSRCIKEIEKKESPKKNLNQMYRKIKKIDTIDSRYIKNIKKETGWKNRFKSKLRNRKNRKKEYHRKNLNRKYQKIKKNR